MSEPWEEGDEVAAEARAAAVNFEAILVSFRKDRNGINLVLAVSPLDFPESIMTAQVGSRYQIAAVRLDDQDRPAVIPELNDGQRAVRSAGMLCRDEEFQSWLGAFDEDSAKEMVYQQCGISSRAELKTNDRARGVWKTLVDRYEEHLRK